MQEKGFAIKFQDHKESFNFLNFIVTNTINVKYQFEEHHKEPTKNIHTKITRETSPNTHI